MSIDGSSKINLANTHFLRNAPLANAPRPWTKEVHDLYWEACIANDIPFCPDEYPEEFLTRDLLVQAFIHYPQTMEESSRLTQEIVNKVTCERPLLIRHVPSYFRKRPALSDEVIDVMSESSHRFYLLSHLREEDRPLVYYVEAIRGGKISSLDEIPERFSNPQNPQNAIEEYATRYGISSVPRHLWTQNMKDFGLSYGHAPEHLPLLKESPFERSVNGYVDYYLQMDTLWRDLFNREIPPVITAVQQQADG